MNVLKSVVAEENIDGCLVCFELLMHRLREFRAIHRDVDAILGRYRGSDTHLFVHRARSLLVLF